MEEGWAGAVGGSGIRLRLCSWHLRPESPRTDYRLSEPLPYIMALRDGTAMALVSEKLSAEPKKAQLAFEAL